MTEFETRAIHVSQDPDANNGAVIPPIYMSSPTSKTELVDFAVATNTTELLTHPELPCRKFLPA
jgi:cystathionine beta-lyase/cystathionine gamma-synthase